MNYNYFCIVLICFGFNLNSQTTSIPDVNFEQALIDQGLDDVIDGSVLTSNINSITSLGVGSKNISDLTGIEDFTALVSLHCDDNNLSTLDLTGNINLTQVYCIFNNLTSLDVSACTALTKITATDNNLISLNTTTNTALKILYVDRNSLGSLNVSTNTELLDFYCSDNQLGILDVSANTKLKRFSCFENNLTSLDVTTNNALVLLVCYSNNLSSLNLKNGANPSIFPFFFNIQSNPNLTCVEVDDPVYSTQNWGNIDPGVTFNTECNNCNCGSD